MTANLLHTLRLVVLLTLTATLAGCADETFLPQTDGRQAVTFEVNKEPWVAQGVTLTRTARVPEKQAWLRVWDFTSLSETDRAALAADSPGWKSLPSEERFSNKTVIDGPVTAGGKELELTKGLLFGKANADRLRIDYGKSGKRIVMNGGGLHLTIPNLKKGQVVTVNFCSASASAERTFATTNLSSTTGFVAATREVIQTGRGTVTEDGNVVLTTSGGLNVFWLTVADGPETQLDNFGVRCDLDGTTLMKDEEVRWDGEKWDYGTPLFWPIGDESAAITTLAYAPYSAGTIDQASKTITYHAATDNTTDLLYAYQAEKTRQETISLTFKHALSRLTFATFTNHYGHNVTLNRITMSIKTSGGEAIVNANPNIAWTWSDSDKELRSPTTLNSANDFTTVVAAVDDNYNTSIMTPTEGVNSGVSMLAMEPKTSGATNETRFLITPKSGLSFRPTHLQANLARFGTDAISINVKVNGTSIAEGLKPARNNKTKAEDTHGATDAYCDLFEKDLSLEDMSSCTLTFEESGLGTGKQWGIGNLRIQGILTSASATGNLIQEGTLNLSTGEWTLADVASSSSFARSYNVDVPNGTSLDISGLGGSPFTLIPQSGVPFEIMLDLTVDGQEQKLTYDTVLDFEQGVDKRLNLTLNNNFEVIIK